MASSGDRLTVPSAGQGQHRQSRGSRAKNTASSGIAHTLTACCRCRQRKTRCDAGLPRCDPCERSNAHCEYFDTTKGRNISRTYIVHLQERVRSLESELAAAEREEQASPDPEMMMRRAGLIKFKKNDESRYLGPSSGIAITRLVMELAKQNTDSKTIKEVVPATKAQEIKDTFDREEGKAFSKVYPSISAVAAPDLPNPDMTQALVDSFMVKSQYMFPTLHEPTFRQDVHDVYNGSKDPYQNFILRMVIAISMQKYDAQFAGLADSYYLAALPFLEECVNRMDVGTVQCFALIAQYSLVTPTRTASYWVVGLAARVCQELGMADEATIAFDAAGARYNALEIDMRRRLFWVITSMEFGLAHSLGRPSAFGTTFDHINVQFFEPVDDHNITPNGVRAGSRPIMKKQIAIHFFKMRLLQAEIRRKLYLKKRDDPKDDRDPWFIEMQAKLDRWMRDCPKDDEGSGLSEKWFRGRLNTMIVFLYRPSPQVPEPTPRAAELAYDASVFNVYMQREQIQFKIVDLTWVFTQSLFMALNSILWALSYPEIRQDHPKEEVIKHLDTAMEATRLGSERWPGVLSALQLYKDLIHGCLKAYESEESYVVHSPSNKPSPASIQDVATPPPLSSPSSVTTVSINSSRHTHATEHPAEPFGYMIDQIQGEAPLKYEPPNQHPAIIGQDGHQPAQIPAQRSDASQLPYLEFATSYSENAFDPNSLYNSFPSVLPGVQHWDPNYTSSQLVPGQFVYASPQMEQRFWLGDFGEQYSQYMHAPYLPTPPRSLSQEQQSELMQLLEETVMPEVTNRPANSSTEPYQ